MGINYIIQERSKDVWKKVKWEENGFITADNAQNALINFLLGNQESAMKGESVKRDASDFRVLDYNGDVQWAPKEVRRPVRADMKERTPCDVFSDGETWSDVSGNVIFLRPDEMEEACACELSAIDEIVTRDYISVPLPELMEAYFQMQELKEKGISIHLDGGLVQQVMAGSHQIEHVPVVVVDSDVDSADPSELALVFYEGRDKPEEAYVSHRELSPCCISKIEDMEK